MSGIKGKISQVIGPVVDVSFSKGSTLPNIMDALVVTKADGTKVVLEVQQHIGDDAIRSIAMDSSDLPAEWKLFQLVSRSSCQKVTLLKDVFLT